MRFNNSETSEKTILKVCFIVRGKFILFLVSLSFIALTFARHLVCGSVRDVDIKDEYGTFRIRFHSTVDPVAQVEIQVNEALVGRMSNSVYFEFCSHVW